MTKHTLNTPPAQSAMSMVRYDAAIRALAECKAVDEVKTWADKAAALQAYGRMAKDKTLEVDAAEIRIRAERRLGEMIAEQKATVGLNPGKLKQGPALVANEDGETPTLAAAGISYDLSSRAQKLAAVPAEEFEKEVKDWRGRVEEEGQRVTARLEQAGERELAKAPAPASECAKCKELESERQELAEEMEAMNDEYQSMVRVLENDEHLLNLQKEVKRFAAQNRILTERLNGKMAECAELTRTAKSWKAKADRFEKQLKALDKDETFVKAVNS